MKNTPNANGPRFIRRDEVIARTGLPVSSIYDRMKVGAFPMTIRLGVGAKAVGWLESEIDAWMSEQIANSRKAA